MLSIITVQNIVQTLLQRDDQFGDDDGNWMGFRQSDASSGKRERNESAFNIEKKLSEKDRDDAGAMRMIWN